MKKISTRLRQCVATLAVSASLVATTGLAANADESSMARVVVPQTTLEVEPSTEAPAPKYTDEEIVGLFVFGAGRAAVEHPEIVAKYVRAPLPEASPATIHDLTKQLRVANPRFHEEVTVPLQSNDAESILEAQTAFGEALQAITKTAPPADAGRGAGRCALWVAAAGAVVVVVAVAGGAVVQTLVAVNVNWVWAYTQPGESSEFARQVKAADLASKL